MPTMTIGPPQQPIDTMNAPTVAITTNERNHPGKALAEALRSQSGYTPTISPDKDNQHEKTNTSMTANNNIAPIVSAPGTSKHMDIDPPKHDVADHTLPTPEDIMDIDHNHDDHTKIADQVTNRAPVTSAPNRIASKPVQGRGAAKQKYYPGRGTSLQRHLATTAYPDNQNDNAHQARIDAMRAAGMPAESVLAIATEMNEYVSQLQTHANQHAPTPHKNHITNPYSILTPLLNKKKKTTKQTASILYHSTQESTIAHAPKETPDTPMTTTDVLDDKHQTDNHHDTDTDAGGEFITVERKKKTCTIKTPAEEKTNNFGIIMTKVATRDSIAKTTINVLQIFAEIQKVDPDVIFLSHDNDKTKLMTMAKMKQMNVQEYNRLLDFVILDWGKPTDEQGKLAFSFYIASNTIQPNLQLLKDSDAVMTLLAKMGLTMNRHFLLETEEKRIGFFLGKSPDKTWRGGLELRFHEYLAQVLTASNVETLRENNPRFPSWIPFSIRTAQIPGKQKSLTAIMLYVGKSDVRPLQHILQQFPFSIEIVSITTKQTNRAQFAKQVDLHAIICQNSQAIKLIDVTKHFTQRLRDVARRNKTVNDMILDIADSSSEDIIFIQCMPRDKTALKEWLVQFICDYTNTYPEATPTIAAFVQSQPEANTPRWSKHQYLLDDETYRSKPSPPTQPPPPTRPNWKHLPSIILTSEHKSYANVTANPGLSSQLSSPTNSVVTDATPRNAPWLEEMEALKKDISILQHDAQSRGEASSARSESSKKSAREIALEEIVLTLNTTLQEKAEREADLLAQLHKQVTAQAEREEDLIAHIKQQTASHKEEIADLKMTYNNMMNLMLTMSRKLDGMSPPRKRTAISPQSDNENDADAESNSASMDTTLSGTSQYIHPNSSTSDDDNLSVIQDMSVLQQDDNDNEPSPPHHLRSPDFPTEPPPC
jgi:hypothetical protein